MGHFIHGQCLQYQCDAFSRAFTDPLPLWLAHQALNQIQRCNICSAQKCFFLLSEKGLFTLPCNTTYPPCLGDVWGVSQQQLCISTSICINAAESASVSQYGSVPMSLDVLVEISVFCAFESGSEKYVSQFK